MKVLATMGIILALSLGTGCAQIGSVVDPIKEVACSMKVLGDLVCRGKIDVSIMEESEAD